MRSVRRDETNMLVVILSQQPSFPVQHLLLSLHVKNVSGVSVGAIVAAGVGARVVGAGVGEGVGAPVGEAVGAVVVAAHVLSKPQTPLLQSVGSIQLR